MVKGLKDAEFKLDNFCRDRQANV